MKLKNTLYIISLFSICAVEAKITGGRPGGYQPGVTPPGSPVPYVPAPGAPAAPKPAPVKNQFQSLLYTIRNSNQDNVIKASGEIVTKIIDDIQNSDLAQEQKQALLQAAVTVKMPLTVANNADTAGVINNAMAQVTRAMSKTTSPIVPITKPEPVENFYDEQTNLIDEDYLYSQIKALPNNLTPTQKINKLTQQLLPKMRNRWDSEGVLFTESYKKSLGSELRKQISNAVNLNNFMKNIGRPSAIDKQLITRMINQLEANNVTDDGDKLAEITNIIINAFNPSKERDDAVARAASIIFGFDVSETPEKSNTEELFSTPKSQKTTAQLLVQKNSWYDAQTHLFDQKTLDLYAKHEAQQQHNQKSSATQLAEIYIEPYFDAISTLWNQDKLNIDEYSQKLLKQVEGSFTKAKNASVQKPTGKKSQTAAKPITSDEALAAVAAVDGLQKAIYAEIDANNPDAENKNTRIAVNNLFKNQPGLAQSNDYERVAEMIGNALESLGIKLNILTSGILEDIIKEIMSL